MDYGFAVYYYGETQPVTITRPILIDLTQMFGAGDEPTTIEDFYSLVPSGIDLFAYNEGEVIHCNTESIKSVGDNALNADRSLVFDFVGSYGNYEFINTEDAFVGISADGYVSQDSIDYAIKIEGGFRLHTNSGGYGIGLFVKALPNEEYSVSYASDKGRIAFSFYDKDKNFISYEMWGNRFTTPSNCEYIMLCLRDNEVVDTDIKFTDIMLTLVHSGWKQDIDAGYQPYWQDTLPLSIVSKYFPQGMKSAGSAHDEIRYNKATQKWEKVVRIDSVDSGSLEWEVASNNRMIATSLENVIVRKEAANDTLLCAKYINAYPSEVYLNSYDKIICSTNVGHIFVYDSSYTDAVSFKAAMQGVILYYELAEPIVTEITEDFRGYYNVADFGTEQSQSSVPSAAFSADIIYQFNAVDMIREHEMEITELQKVIATMQAQLASLTNS